MKPGQTSMTTGTIMGRRRVRSCTNRPRAERARRLRVSKSATAAVRRLRLLDGGQHHLAGLVEQLLRLGGVHPAPGDYLGPGEDVAGARVDRDDDDDDALLGQELAVPQHPPAHVADDAVDVQVAGRHLAGEVDAVGGHLDHVAVLGQQHRLAAAPPSRWPGGRGA